MTRRVTTSGITRDNEWQWMTTSGTTSDNEWQWVVISANFLFSFREDSTNRHPKENPLNLEEDFEVGPTELKADLANQAR